MASKLAVHRDDVGSAGEARVANDVLAVIEEEGGIGS